ncbi:galactokinase [Robiginitalea myxolifaciens]|uniref:Galactokinase n=1 Tax=Robiginitalea myxolifaciens TaxID=400055 RepID=A0A1I6GC49_9FLAO|nr:galactokinase [Robiginitalea myxolifaciens]SFR39647.1 galactokinase [Robiginitalea myxolifaciens]
MANKSRTIRVAAPGRINLIGEHIDYNDGWVLPAAIDRCIYLTMTANGDDTSFTVTSEDFGSTFSGDLDQLEKGGAGWHQYILGVLSEIRKRSDGLRGFSCTLHSEIPVGSGVSSSAALESGLAFGLNELFDLGLSPWDLIHIGQDAEHNFVGTACGIMDQFASVMGKSGHCMLLDCKSLEFEYVPAAFGSYKLLLLNSNVSHNLASSGYNSRREESATALTLLSDYYESPPSYRALTRAQIEAAQQLLSPNQYKRATFVVAEIERVRRAVQALRENDLEEFGALMYQSHEGLSTRYEVSCPELDFLVDLTRNNKCIAGARMMGGGFGGCTLNLIHQEAIEAFVSRAAAAYKNRFSLDLNWFEATPSAGTRLL